MYTILVVDDHPETLQVVSLILRQNGYQVLTAENGREGLEMAQQHMPHLILMDVMMPEMDGTEACRRIRQIPELERIPIIMFTVKAQVDDKWAGFQAGADDYLIKPTDPEELLARIASLIVRSPINKVTGPLEINTGGLVSFDSGPLGSSPIVLFVGARGGVGTTMAAINFTAALTRLDQNVLLVDLDMAQGHIALYLKQKFNAGLNNLTKHDGADLKLEIPQHIITYEEGWQLLLSQVNLDRRMPALSKPQADILIKTLKRPERWIVADLGCGIQEFHEPLLTRADHIFVCLRPERIAISAARLLLRRLAVYCRHEAVLQPLMLDFFGHGNLSQQAVEEFLQYRLAGILPVKAAHMNQFVNNGQMLPSDDPASAVLHKIAQTLISQNE